MKPEIELNEELIAEDLEGELDCDENAISGIKIFALILIFSLISPMIYSAVNAILRSSIEINRITGTPTPEIPSGFLHF